MVWIACCDCHCVVIGRKSEFKSSRMKSLFYPIRAFVLAVFFTLFLTSFLHAQTCVREVGNTRGCAKKAYVIWLKDKDGKAHHLEGDSTKYRWIEYANGDVKFVAEAISASGLNGTFDIDLTFSGRTLTPPTNSPKYSSCFSVSSVVGWEYFTTTNGTISSTHYGTMTIERKGPAFQLGNGANITQNGFGASGWLDISGGNGHITTGDINVMLSTSCSTRDTTIKLCKNDSFMTCLDNLMDVSGLFNSITFPKVYTQTVNGHYTDININTDTATDCCNGEKPSSITYEYVAGNNTDNSQGSKSKVTTYTVPTGQKVLIVINDESSESDTSGAFFQGSGRIRRQNFGGA